jgi:hypothetical protein
MGIQRRHWSQSPSKNMVPLCESWHCLGSRYMIEEKKGRRAWRLLDNLHLCFDHKRIRYSKAIHHLRELHEFLPTPVMLLLTEPMQRICTLHKELGMIGIGVVAAHRTNCHRGLANTMRKRTFLALAYYGKPAMIHITAISSKTQSIGVD